MNNKNAKPPNLDRDYADRLKNENPQQFETLVKMHMSFELDLHTDELIVFFFVLIIIKLVFKNVILFLL